MPRIDVNSAQAGSPLIRVLAILARPLIWLLHCLLGRPRDSVLAILVASAVSAIVFNSLFLQHGPHPAPMFARVPSSAVSDQQRDVPAHRAVENTSLSRTAGIQQAVQPQRTTAADESTGAVAAVLPRQRPAEAPPKVQQVATRAASKDAIAEILAPAQQLTSIQRALSNYGYGQIVPNGVLGPDTRTAIERFERERRLPVTGQVSERLVRELVAMTGKPL